MKALRNKGWLIAGAALSLTACASLIGVFVDRRDQIRAPHDRHKKADVDCATCHETIFDAKDLTTQDLPKEKVCLGCHKKEKESGNCGFCHTRPDKPETFARIERELKVNHTEHIERVKEDCTQCHKQLPQTVRTEGIAPAMAGCLGCHNHQEDWNAGRCETCHLDLTRYPLKPVAEFSHKGDWLRDHKTEARSAPQMCSNCHEQSFCSQCHNKTEGLRVDLLIPERTDRSFIHRNDFLSRHSVEAVADPAKCERCHGVDFCQSCHVKNGLVPGAADGLNPHPKGFGMGAEHGRQARQDITSCAACHDQGAASICVKCHQVGGVGGNPHPPSYTIRHPKEEIGKNAMCRVCHL